jgi:alginate O-acetyltransferase complex protein AlgJ
VWFVLSSTVAMVSAANAAAPEPAQAAVFKKDCVAKADAAEKTDSMTVAGKDGWLFLAGELRHVSAGKFWGEDAAKVSAADKPENADPLPAIVDFKAQLDRAGVQLIFLPVPAKAVIYPDKLSDAVIATDGNVARLDVEQQAFYKLLRDKGLTVLDLTDDLLAHRLDAEGAMFCKQDTHWSGRACMLASAKIAAMLKDEPWLKAAPKLKLASQIKPLEINGDLMESLTGPKPPRETLSLRYVGTHDGATLAPVPTDRASPVLLLGDSHNLIFHSGGDMQAEGAGLADQLALDLGIAVDLIAVRGSGATPARVNLLRQTRSDPTYLAKKKVIIWCFTCREFTRSSGWQKVPVVK